MLKRLYSKRFEIFFITQLAILFGSLIIPTDIYENYINQLLQPLNILAGILLVSKKKNLTLFLLLLLLFTMFVTGSKLINYKHPHFLDVFELLAYFLFYTVVVTELILQIWKAEVIDMNEILGLISGYIGFGFIGYFICMAIELNFEGSFAGLREGITLSENILYFSYVTLLTIGYGDILPVTTLAQRAVIFIGMIGQMYLVIITAIVVGKYVNQAHSNK